MKFLPFGFRTTVDLLLLLLLKETKIGRIGMEGLKVPNGQSGAGKYLVGGFSRILPFSTFYIMVV